RAGPHPPAAASPAALSGLTLEPPAMQASQPLTPAPSALARLCRLEAQFLRPHRRVILLALAGMFLQSALLLPIPLLQGWVIDRLVALSQAAADAAETTRIILIALGASVACYGGRTALAWKVTAVMSRVSLEV